MAVSSPVMNRKEATVAANLPYIPPSGIRLAQARARIDRKLLAQQTEELRQRLPDDMKSLVDGIAEIEKGAVPDHTDAAYRSDQRHYKRFCERLGLLCELEVTLPQFKAYILAMKKDGLSAGTIKRRLRGVAALFREAGIPSPTVTTEVRGFLRRVIRDMDPAIPKLAIVAANVVKMLAILDETVDRELLEKAVIALMFSAALRRSELVGLRVQDIVWDPRGIALKINHSKTNQVGRPEAVAVPKGDNPQTCPVAILERYLARTGYSEGPLFRAFDRWGNPSTTAMCSRTAAEIVKRLAARIGLNSTKIAAHSLRRGFVKTALLAGRSIKSIKKITRHRRDQTVIDYAREEAPFAVTPDMYDQEGLL